MSNFFTIRSFTLYLLFFVVTVLQLSCRGGVNNESAFYKSVLKKADSIAATGNKRTAVNFIDSMYAQRPGADGYMLYQRYFFKERFYYYTQKDFDSTTLFVDSMLYALESNHIENKYAEDYALALNAKADYYYDVNDLDKAFEFYYKSKAVAQKSKDTCAFSNQSYHLGMITYRQEKYWDAIGYFRQSLTEHTKCHTDAIAFYRAQELLNNIALAHTKLQQYDSARWYYNRALAHLETEGKKFGTTIREFSEKATGVIYGNLAKIFIARNQNDSAEYLLRKSIELNIRPGFETKDAILAQMQLAELYYRTGRLEPMSALIGEIQDEVDTMDDKNLVLKLEYLKYLYHIQKAEPTKALRYLQNYVRVRDSVDVINRKLNVTDVNQVFKNREILYQNDLLRQNYKLNQMYLAVTIGLVIMTLLLVGVIYYNFRKSKKNIRILTLLNKQINEQKEQLELAANELTQSNRDKDRILSVVAHDLRNPVSGIMLLAETMLEDEEELDRNSLELIRKTSANSLGLINDLMEFRSDANIQKSQQYEIVDVKDLLEQVVHLQRLKAAEKQLQLVLHPTDQKLRVKVNKDKIWRVFTNIVGNAVKFSPPGSVIDIQITRLEHTALITVKDHGIGIPEDLKPVIFDMFTTAKRSGTAGERSYGLGLSICKQIVENHGGTIWFDSVAGEGTTFYVALFLE